LTSSTPIRYRSSRRASSIEVATTRTTILATASQEHLSSLEIVVLSARWASQATTSSKSFVCRAPGRAHGTSSVTTLSHLGQRSPLARRLSVTTTPAGVNSTPATVAPGRPNILLNAVLTRTCLPFRGRCGWLANRRTYRGSDTCASSVAALWGPAGPERTGQDHPTGLTRGLHHPREPEESQKYRANIGWNWYSDRTRGRG